MLFFSWLRHWERSAPAARRPTQTSPGQRAGFRPRLEALEDRWLPSTLTVTDTQDHGRGTLRAEITAALARLAADERAAWQQLWAELETLLRATRGAKKE
jgi:hypothetical protein